MAKYKNRNLNKFLKLTKALSDKTRVRLLMSLREGELCVCQITELFQLAPSTISKHLSILKEAGLIDARKDGRWMHYNISKDMDEIIKDALDITLKSLKKDSQVIRDNERLDDIIKINKEELCQKNKN